MSSFTFWAFGDAHVGTDGRRGRQSLHDAIVQAERDFDWDIAVDVGDMSGGQTTPEDDEGEEVVRQYGALSRHRREDVYDICGNHDRSGPDEAPAWWWRKWLDPTGEHTAHSGVDASRRPYPVEGTWERYSFRVGNLLFLMMSDVNPPDQPIGRGTLGGNPGGAVSAETYAWWQAQVEANPDAIIISAHHYMLRETTVASGEFEGFTKDAQGNWFHAYHGYKPLGTPRGASYLYWTGNQPNAQAFERYLEAHPGAVDLWLGGHTHSHPDDTCGGKSHVETRWGTHFVNVCALTRWHGPLSLAPMSRVFSFTEGSDEVRVRCYLHSDDYREPGWYPEKERVLKLKAPFERP